jgi:hypothetical protein
MAVSIIGQSSDNALAQAPGGVGRLLTKTRT